jgi:hypothetical protein
MAEAIVEKARTILVVNEKVVPLKLVVDTLKAAKFVVLQANNGPRAKKIVTEYLGTIDLVLVEAEMPGVSGVTLKWFRPDVQVLLTCGDILVSPYGCVPIHNPFMPGKLLEMISDVLRAVPISHRPRRLSAGYSR